MPGIPNAAELQSPVGDRHSHTAPKRHRDPRYSVPRDDESQYSYTYDSYTDEEAVAHTENAQILVLQPASPSPRGGGSDANRDEPAPALCDEEDGDRGPNFDIYVLGF